jgi:CRP/FNR family transcriptional regulator, cyclic AMP receptor protein
MDVHDRVPSRVEAALPRARELVLELDRELLDAVPAERAGRARAASLATVEARRAGSWDAAADAGLARGGFGLLVTGGVLVRRVGVEGRFGAELLASGDLLRPWQHDGEAGALPFEMAWRIVAPLRFAVLDRAWAARMAPFPEVAAELVGRALERSRRLATLMAIAQQPRLDQRVWLLFWELADRHGRVHPDGVHLDLRLTHEVISHLVAARRPSVSTALSSLASRGILRREGGGWVLSGPPPDEPPGEEVTLPGDA